MATFRGTHGDDNITGTSGDDNFILVQGGNDTVDAGDGDDIFRMGATLNAGDKLDGGAGKDFIVLNGDYSAGVVFNDDTITNIEVMGLDPGHSYNLTLADGNVATGQRLLVKAGTLGVGNTLTFDGSAETDGKYTIIAGAGSDTLTGGAKADVFDLSKGGSDTAHGGGGTDTFLLGAAFTSADTIDGGAGNDTVVLAGMGDDSINFTATTMTGVETLVLGAGPFYTLTTNDATVATGATLTVNATALGAGVPLLFNGSHETDGNFVFAFGGGYSAFDTITGGAGNDTLELHGNYSGGYTFSAAQIASIETLKLDDGFSYNLTTNNANVGSGDTLTVDATALSGAHTLTFNGAAETDGAFTFEFAGNFTASDHLTGGAGDDTLELHGNYNAGIQFDPATITNVETLKLDDGFGYNIVTDDGNVASGGTLTIDASALTGSNVLIFNGEQETDGAFHIRGGAGGDTLMGGNRGDTLTGGAGADTFNYFAAAQSTSTNYDTITDFAAGTDHFFFANPLPITTVDQTAPGAPVDSGANFDSELANVAGFLQPTHALVLTVTDGTLSGHTFVIIDGDSTTHQYTPGVDYVVDVTGYTGTFTATDF
jgi:hypothetical protein